MGSNIMQDVFKLQKCIEKKCSLPKYGHMPKISELSSGLFLIKFWPKKFAPPRDYVIFDTFFFEDKAYRDGVSFLGHTI